MKFLRIRESRDDGVAVRLFNLGRINHVSIEDDREGTKIAIDVGGSIVVCENVEKAEIVDEQDVAKNINASAFTDWIPVNVIGNIHGEYVKVKSTGDPELVSVEIGDVKLPYSGVKKLKEILDKIV